MGLCQHQNHDQCQTQRSVLFPFVCSGSSTKTCLLRGQEVRPVLCLWLWGPRQQIFSETCLGTSWALVFNHHVAVRALSLRKTSCHKHLLSSVASTANEQSAECRLDVFDTDVITEPHSDSSFSFPTALGGINDSLLPALRWDTLWQETFNYYQICGRWSEEAVTHSATNDLTQRHEAKHVENHRKYLRWQTATPKYRPQLNHIHTWTREEPALITSSSHATAGTWGHCSSSDIQQRQ